MSTVPNLSLVCGIDDAKEKDERHILEVDYDELIIGKNDEDGNFMDYMGEGRKEIYLSDILLYGSPYSEFRSLPVIGYIISNSEEDVARVYSMIYCDEKDHNSSKDVPYTSPNDLQKLEMMHYRKSCMPERFDRVMNRWRKWYDTFTPFYIDLYFSRARYIFDRIGWNGVTDEMLKLMLVFYWS